MDPERWSRINELFFAALEQPTDERAAFIERGCAGDAELQCEVERLLAADRTEHSRPFLDATIARVQPATAGGALQGSMIGRRIGPYEIRGLIGHGGMGDVYRAERVGDFEQTVAIKLIRREMGSALLLDRFRTEIRVQGELGRHPNIVGLMDAGTTDDGVPYFVMEYVDGERIDRYCNAHQLGTRERLSLFRTICEAVHYAHQHAVIHRDLKPSNILVTAEGAPRLIDFGIAKLMDAGPEMGSGLPTVTGFHPMTPEYASPEQVRGEALTTASDVYALGVILYELLTGHRPYHLSSRVAAEVQKVICLEEPVKPSAAIDRRATVTDSEGTTSKLTPESIGAARGETPRQLRARLAGDLDNIVLMALCKEPRRRYASADSLSADLQRYLDGLPVTARKASAGYRLSKFVRRHRAGVAVAAVFLLTLLGGFAGTGVGMLRARRAQDQAEANFALARTAVDDLYTRISEDVLLNTPGFHGLRRQLLERVLVYYKTFLARQAKNTDLRYEMASTYLRIGAIYRLIGSSSEAINAYREALGLLEALVRGAPENRTFRYELATNLNDLGLIQSEIGAAEEAMLCYEHSRGLYEDLVAADPRESYRQDLANTLYNLGNLDYQSERLEAALDLHRRAKAIRERLVTEFPRNPDHRNELANSFTALGAIRFNGGHFAEGLANDRQADELYKALVRDYPDVGDYAHRRGMILANLGLLEWREGKLDDAMRSVREAVVILGRLASRNPLVAAYQAALAGANNMLSDLLRATGGLDQSREPAEKALTILQRLVADYPDVLDYRVHLSKAHNNIGRIRMAEGRPMEALAAFQRAAENLESLSQRFPNDHYNLACNLALCIPLVGAGKPELTAEDRALRDTLAERAMAAFRLSVTGGYGQLRHIREDRDLDSLRKREDFQLMILDLAFPVDPFQRQLPRTRSPASGTASR
jgi:eukaryotic-like serine/threonine-protein kinase